MNERQQFFTSITFILGIIFLTLRFVYVARQKALDLEDFEKEKDESHKAVEKDDTDTRLARVIKKLRPGQRGD